MPKEITHLLAAEAIAPLLPDNAPDLLGKHRGAYLFGSISPDFLYYDIDMPWARRGIGNGVAWADAMHGTGGEDNFGHLVAMQKILTCPRLQGKLKPDASALSEDERQMLLSFALGYLTHAALDMQLHPLVFYYSGNPLVGGKKGKQLADTRHHVIETVLDLHVLEDRGYRLSAFSTYRNVKLPRRQRDLVLGFLVLSLRLAFGSSRKPLQSGCTSIEASSFIQDDPLFQVARRCYRRHMWAIRLYRNRLAATCVLALNRLFAGRIQTYSSLFYPKTSYKKYLRSRPGFLFSQIDSYRDPYTGTTKIVSEARIKKKVLAHSRKLMRLYLRAHEGQLSLAQLSRRLRGYSLNNGRERAALAEMKHEAPLLVDGNFMAA